MSDAEARYIEFVRARSTALLRTAYLMTGDRGLAEDLVQTALGKVFSSWRRIRDPQAAEAYARRTVITTALSWRRRRSWYAERPSADVSADTDLAAADLTGPVAQRLDLWASVQRLPMGQRAVVVLRFYEDLSEAQTAEVLGCSQGTVKSQTARAMAALRRDLGAEAAADKEASDAAPRD